MPGEGREHLPEVLIRPLDLWCAEEPIRDFVVFRAQHHIRHKLELAILEHASLTQFLEQVRRQLHRYPVLFLEHPALHLKRGIPLRLAEGLLQGDLKILLVLVMSFPDGNEAPAILLAYALILLHYHYVVPEVPLRYKRIRPELRHQLLNLPELGLQHRRRVLILPSRLISEGDF